MLLRVCLDWTVSSNPRLPAHVHSALVRVDCMSNAQIVEVGQVCKTAKLKAVSPAIGNHVCSTETSKPSLLQIFSSILHQANLLLCTLALHVSMAIPEAKGKSNLDG